MKLIVTKDIRVEEYENLLIKRDEIKKYANSYLISYIAEFGELITQVFEAKIECIKKKKSIAFCQRAINRGQRINAKALKQFIDKNMAEYYQELDNMIKTHEEAVNAKTVSKATVHQCGKLYKKIAKAIHPDMNSEVAENTVIKNLWMRTCEAHKYNDLKALEELAVLVEKAMHEEGFAGIEIRINNIDEKIKSIKQEIKEIKTTTPYTYGVILENPLMSDEKKTELQIELEEYREYGKELDEILANFGLERENQCRIN